MENWIPKANLIEKTLVEAIRYILFKHQDILDISNLGQIVKYNYNKSKKKILLNGKRRTPHYFVANNYSSWVNFLKLYNFKVIDDKYVSL
jgi:hypothetical protein